MKIKTVREDIIRYWDLKWVGNKWNITLLNKPGNMWDEFKEICCIVEWLRECMHFEIEYNTMIVERGISENSIIAWEEKWVEKLNDSVKVEGGKTVLEISRDRVFVDSEGLGTLLDDLFEDAVTGYGFNWYEGEEDEWFKDYVKCSMTERDEVMGFLKEKYEGKKEETYTITINQKEGIVLKVRKVSGENKKELQDKLLYADQFVLINLGDNFVVINMEEVINIQCVKDVKEEEV